MKHITNKNQFESRDAQSRGTWYMSSHILASFNIMIYITIFFPFYIRFLNRFSPPHAQTIYMKSKQITEKQKEI